MLDIAIVRVGVRPVGIKANKLDLLSMGTPGTNWLVVPSSLPLEAREDERNEQDAASRSQGDDRDEQVLLLSLEAVEVRIWSSGGVAAARKCILDV